MGRQEPVLDDEERRVRGFGDAPGDRREVGGLLGVAGKEDAPARVGDAHHVVVAGVDVERLAGERPGPHVEDDRQSLAAQDVEDLLHEDEALPGGEVRHPPARKGHALGGRRRAVLRFRLEEAEGRPPQVGPAAGDGRLKDGRHGGGWGDRVGAGDLGDPGLDVGDRLRAVHDRRDAGVRHVLHGCIHALSVPPACPDER